MQGAVTGNSETFIISLLDSFIIISSGGEDEEEEEGDPISWCIWMDGERGAPT